MVLVNTWGLSDKNKSIVDPHRPSLPCLPAPDEQARRDSSMGVDLRSWVSLSMSYPFSSFSPLNHPIFFSLSFCFLTFPLPPLLTLFFPPSRPPSPPSPPFPLHRDKSRRSGVTGPTRSFFISSSSNTGQADLLAAGCKDCVSLHNTHPPFYSSTLPPSVYKVLVCLRKLSLISWLPIHPTYIVYLFCLYHIYLLHFFLVLFDHSLFFFFQQSRPTRSSRLCVSAVAVVFIDRTVASPRQTQHRIFTLPNSNRLDTISQSDPIQFTTTIESKRSNSPRSPSTARLSSFVPVAPCFTL